MIRNILGLVANSIRTTRMLPISSANFALAAIAHTFKRQSIVPRFYLLPVASSIYPL